MWQSKTSAADLAASDFGDFVSDELPRVVSTQKYGVPRPEASVSLMDILELWLAEGNGFDSCPSFESFVVAVVLIIDDWDNSERNQIDGASLWPPTPEKKIPLFAEQGDDHPRYSGDRGHFSIVQRYDCEYLRGIKQLIERRNSSE